jgi:hypothetical protein
MQKASATSKANGTANQTLNYATIAVDILRDLAQASHIPFLQNAGAAISCVFGETNVRVFIFVFIVSIDTRHSGNEDKPGNALAHCGTHTPAYVCRHLSMPGRTRYTSHQNMGWHRALCQVCSTVCAKFSHLHLSELFRRQTSVQLQQELGKIKHLFREYEIGVQLRAYEVGLHTIPNTFKVSGFRF